MIELIFKQRILLCFKLLQVKVQPKSVFRKYSAFIQNISVVTKFQRITICRFATRFAQNYNLQGFKEQGFKELQYVVDLQLDLQRIAT